MPDSLDEIEATTSRALELHNQLEREGISHDEIVAILGAGLGYSLTQVPPASRRMHITAHLEALGNILNAAGVGGPPIQRRGDEGAAKIDSLWAWIATTPDGAEGVVGGNLPEAPSLLTPFVGADRARIESFRGQVMVAAAGSGYPIKLVRFGRPEIMERLGKGSAH